MMMMMMIGGGEEKKAFNEVMRHYQHSITYIQEASLTPCFHH
jgi:hypothetical protein